MPSCQNHNLITKHAVLGRPQTNFDNVFLSFFFYLRTKRGKRPFLHCVHIGMWPPSTTGMGTGIWASVCHERTNSAKVYTYDCCLSYEECYVWKDPNLPTFRSYGLFVINTAVLAYFQHYGWTFLFMRTSRMKTVFNKCPVNTLKEKDYKRSPKCL